MSLRLLLLACILFPAPVVAQEGSGSSASSATMSLPTESRVRVLMSADASWLTGRVSEIRGDTLALEVRGTVHAVPLRELQRFEQSRGRNRWLWAGGGALAGATAGVIYSRATSEDDPGDIGGVRSTADGVGNTIAGALLGALVGYFMAPERWRAVALPGRN